MDKLKKVASAGDPTIAMAEDAGCKYCAALEEVNDPAEGDCPYCAAMDAQPADSLANCKYCNNAAASGPAGEACQYCARPEAGPAVSAPTTTNSEDFAGQGLDAPAIPKPIPGEDPQEQVTPMDDTTNNNLSLDQKGQGESNVQVSAGPAPADGSPSESVQVDQSKEAMQSIAQQIEQTPADGGVNSGPGPQGAAAAMATDDAALAPGTNVVDGVSRPAGYPSNTPGDMGIAPGSGDDDAPDLGAVLGEGLDAHADNIQREKVVQMVSQALAGFKQCKHIIELSQTQAPQLYSSSIMMLKAMIEMAKMLGLEQAGPVAQPQSEWQNPFPTHPDQGGQPAPGHAPAAGSASTDGDANTGNEWQNPFPAHPDNGGAAPGGTIGQPVGKLPTGQTTPHVARTPLAPGAVNAQGQKKYVDPETGKESFINMKEGRVLNESGKPVKPPQG